jgi:hypothetical protein
MNSTACTIVFAVLYLAIATISDAQPNLTTSHGAKNQGKATLAVKGVPYYIDTEIAAGIDGDESLARGIYTFHFKCASDLTCQLDVVALNECDKKDKSEESHFSPRGFSWNTSSGILEVKQLSDSQVELTVYQASWKKLPAKILLTYDTKSIPFRQLKEFKGTGFIDRRSWPDLSKRVDYVPVQSDRTKKLDCPVFLHGMNRANGTASPPL